MKKSGFDGLLKSLGEAQEFARNPSSVGFKVHIPDEVNVAEIRAATGLSQTDFSDQIGVSVATLRNWEQRRRAPEGPARVLLALLAKNPKIVQRLLGRAA
jgi:putative transcriptional regulator